MTRYFRASEGTATGSGRTRRGVLAAGHARDRQDQRGDTGGEYGLVEITVRAGEGSPWHVHPDEDEWFYVLDGEFTVYVGDAASVASGGLVRVRSQGSAAHLHRGDGRRRER